MRATGTFDVKLTTVTAGDVTHRTIDKTFAGDLEATSVGAMLAVMSETKGSAGYVALERVTGTVSGKRGTFALQHFGVMNRGASELVVRVVPDSGTGDLVGISGTMTIDIRDGKHFYVFEHTVTSASG